MPTLFYPNMTIMRTNDMGDATLNGREFNGVHVALEDGSSEFVSAAQIAMVAKALAAAEASDENGYTTGDGSNRGKVTHALIALKHQVRA